jgi:hypothetical protein
MSHVYDNLTHRGKRRHGTDHAHPHDLDFNDLATAANRPRAHVTAFDRDLDGWLEGSLAPAGRQTRGADAEHTAAPATALAGRVVDEYDAESAQRDRARLETLVTVLRKMAFEMRSLRNDVEQIKATMARGRAVTDAEALAAGRPGPDDRPAE